MRAKTTNFGIFLALITILLTGCSTRSISNSGYQDENGWYGQQANPFYQGELNELSVLGISAEQAISEADIQAALNDAAAVTLKRGNAILLIQSGAMFPDDAMLQAMQEYFTVAPLSGVPEQSPQTYHPTDAIADPQPSLKQVLRLSAAQTGATTVIVYWGIIETAQEDQVTKTVSWVPIVGALIPDEVQRMRIRLKGVVMDVKSGKWLMLTPPEADSAAISGRLDREAADQQQVARMKTQAYQNFMQALRQRFAIQ